MLGKRIQISGVVQGVGFRPFVYNTAKHFGIKGTVKNDSSGVDIYACGESLEAFIEEIRTNPPPLAKIHDIQISDVEVDIDSFAIIESTENGVKTVDISVDTRTCNDCLKEFHDPDDRRYEYPFINCTHCGPRYTIIKDVPYDRPFTSMAEFPMCPECETEYNDPGNRRFHAQPNCCPVCGPQYENPDKAIDFLKQGKIVAIKGIGGYHLCCDARNEETVSRMRSLKDRDQKPFAVMAASEKLLDLTENEKKLITGIERPIMLIDKSRAPEVCESVAPSLSSLGVMLPYAPIHYLLFEKGGFDVLVMTSGNRKHEPMVKEDGEKKLGNIADFILEHNREIVVRNDDTVIREFVGEPVFLRRSRGYAPAPVVLGHDVSGLIASGAMLKNSIAVGRGNRAYLSQYIGDLENEDTYESLIFTAEHLQKMFGIQAEAVVCDMHPDYLSTHFAESLGLPVIRVQHHRAHARSCMAENRIEKAISVVFDGVGFGEDKNSWGGEMFSVDGPEMIREAHFSYMPMPGGDICVKHPLRLAAAILHGQGISLPEMEDVIELLEKDVNVHYTSAAGRLFDAASALIGVCTHQTYEGQAPMELEAAAAPLEEAGSYEPTLDCGELLKQIYEDTSPADLRAARFHNTIINTTASEVLRIAERTGQDNVCFSGGCFQNVLLLEGVIRELDNKLNVYMHRLVPPNDGGIALGQLVEASIQRSGK